MMHIRDLSERTGASPRSLRHYEQLGLITPERGSNNYRHYDEGAVLKVRAIRVLLRNGFTLEEVRPFAACLGKDVREPQSAAFTLNLLKDKAVAVDARIRDLEDLRDSIEQLIARVEPYAVPVPDRPNDTPIRSERSKEQTAGQRRV